MTSVSGEMLLTFLSSSTPLMPGIIRSVKMIPTGQAQGVECLLPSAAGMARISPPKIFSRLARLDVSSSTISIVGCISNSSSGLDFGCPSSFGEHLHGPRSSVKPRTGTHYFPQD